MLRLLMILFICQNPVILDGSISYGTTSNGRLECGVQLPSKGPNFTSYSKIGELLGRTYVHSKVKKVVVDAYKKLELDAPGKIFKYAETGLKEGGRFKPHKTHQNGLSIDFMVPVSNKQGQSVHLPTHMFNKFGYAIEFDKAGNYSDVAIDFEAMAAHLVCLHKAAHTQGINIWRVIFDPELQPFLMKTKYETYLRTHIQFSKKRSWVRHDEHYHVDFAVPCKPL